MCGGGRHAAKGVALRTSPADGSFSVASASNVLEAAAFVGERRPVFFLTVATASPRFRTSTARTAMSRSRKKYKIVAFEIVIIVVATESQPVTLAFDPS